MRILTPELTAFSLQSITNAPASVELDFDLSRRTAIIINRVIGQIKHQKIAAEQITLCCQELDLDPDNTAIIGGHPSIVGSTLDLDSTRIFRQIAHAHTSIVATSSYGFVDSSNLVLEWYQKAMIDRPITVSNMRHHVEIVGNAGDVGDFILQVSYQLVELSDSELGLVSILRR